MAAYATLQDIKDRILRDLSTDEETVATSLLEDAAVIIDDYNQSAPADAKKVVSCRMVIRALGDGDSSMPMGATQGTMSGLGYSQSWTMGSGGSTGELYIGKLEKKLLGVGDMIGSHSPTEDIK